MNLTRRQFTTGLLGALLGGALGFSREAEPEEIYHVFELLPHQDGTWSAHWKELSEYAEVDRRLLADGPTMTAAEVRMLHDEMVARLARSLEPALTSPEFPWFALRSEV